MYQIATHKAHAEAAQMCMGYISVFLKQEPSRGNLELWQCFPMLPYVFSSGFNHLAHIDSESLVALGALQSLGSDVRHHPSHWDRLCELREEILEWPFAPWPSSKHDIVLYILIAYSPPALLRTFLFTICPLRPRMGTNPLVYAAYLRKTEHAMVLLAYGADVDVRGLVIDDSYRASPLEIAIGLGDDILVLELLRRGCLVPSWLLGTAVCMPWCSTQVLALLMQTDEFVEWALEIGEQKLYRSIFSSARPNSGDTMKADEDHVILARRLRQVGLDLSAGSQFGKELIERALHAAHMSMLEFLLPPDQPSPAEFLIAASTGDTSETISVICFLLQKGVDVHVVSGQRRDTVLHLAAMCPLEPRSLELTRLLINAGCDPRTPNSDGETPLVVAARHGHCSVVELLLSCNVPLPSDILHVALERRWNSQKIEFLLRSGANIHAVVQPTLNTVLHCAIIGPKLDEDPDGREGNGYKHQESECFALVKRFLKACCDPTMRNSSGETAVEIALQRSFLSVVELLLLANVPLPPNALLIAAQQNLTLEMVDYLIQKGVDVQSTTSDGDTVLHLALARYYTEETCRKLVKRLINAGCDTTARNSTGKTALTVAIQRNLTFVVELLLSSQDDPLPSNILLIAARGGSNLEMVDYLIQRGADVRSTTSDMDTVLHLALNQYYAEETCCELVKRLINAGCDTSARNSTGETALELALEHSITSVVELLLPSYAPLPSDVLLIAAEKGSNLEMVDYLIRRGADVRSTTTDVDTALHLVLGSQYYAEEECCQLVKRLINAGCDTSARNSTGETALEIALEHNMISVVKLLLPSDFPLPRDILLIATRKGSNLEMVEYLIQRGANVHSTTSNGDTVLHVTLATYHTEEEQCKFLRCLINAGCNPSTCNSKGNTALLAAIERDYSSVAELLLSFNASLPRNILRIAFGRRCKPPMIQVLARKAANDHLGNVSGSDWDTLLQLAHIAYSGQYNQQVTEILEAARKSSRTRPNSEDETYAHVAKRPRLYERE